MGKVARREGKDFDCPTCFRKPNELPKEEFKREVERHLTGKETEDWELIYFDKIPALAIAAYHFRIVLRRGLCY